MATFAKASFSAAGYAAFRPSYSQKIFNTILAYHSGPTSLLLDLGTGHGTIPRTLSTSFTKIIGTDPSPSMISQARSSTPQENITYQPGSAEDLSFLSDSSLDMVTAGQSAHWFDYTKAWPSLASKVRSKGTLAFIGYIDIVFPSHPRASKLIDYYSYHPSKLGPYWEAGRQVLADKLAAVTPPAQEWEDVKRITYQPGDDPKEGVLFAKTLKLGEVEGYLRTFSSYTNWKEAHKEENDLVDEAMKDIVDSEVEWKAKGEEWRDVEVDVEWGSVILLARRR